jgi:hypothetical protein
MCLPGLPIAMGSHNHNIFPKQLAQVCSKLGTKEQTGRRQVFLLSLSNLFRNSRERYSRDRYFRFVWLKNSCVPLGTAVLRLNTAITKSRWPASEEPDG